MGRKDLQLTNVQVAFSCQSRRIWKRSGDRCFALLRSKDSGRDLQHHWLSRIVLSLARVSVPSPFGSVSVPWINRRNNGSGASSMGIEGGNSLVEVGESGSTLRCWCMSSSPGVMDTVQRIKELGNVVDHGPDEVFGHAHVSGVPFGALLPGAGALRQTLQIESSVSLNLHYSMAL